MKKILHLSTRLQVALIIIFALVIFELLFDPVEIILGNILYWTNPLRPKIGRLWTEEHKDRAGSGEVALLSETATEGFPLEKLVDENNFISLLFYFGLLSIVRSKLNRYVLNIPNETIRRLYYDYIKKIYDETDTE